MKPAFALDFRDGVVALLHRTARGWMAVGQTTFDSPDLDEALGFLRSTALGLSPGGLATKLIIPGDQILYTTIRAPGPDAAKRRRQIAAGLEGMTPYEVEDLVFDWWGKGEEVQVAVIARETLAEAESFAHAHRFNPVSFVAVPENGLFQGEPWFGPTSVASSILAEGEKVDRDQDPVKVLGRDAPAGQPVAALDPAPEVAPAPVEPEPELVAASIEEPVAEVATEQLPEPEPAPGPEPEPDPVAPGLPEPALPEPELPEPELPEPFPQAPPELEPPSEPMAPAAPVEIPQVFPDTDPGMPEPFDLPFVPAMQGRVAGMDEAPMALDVTDEVSENAVTAPSLRPEPQSEVAKPSALSILQAFASRRRGADAEEPSAKPVSAPAPLRTEPRIAAASTPAPTATFSTNSDPDTKPATQSRIDAPENSGLAVIGAAAASPGKTAVAKPAFERPSLARPMPAASGKTAGKSGSAKGLKGFSALVTAPGIAGSRKTRPPISASAMAASQAASTAAAAGRSPTKPIGLGTRMAPQRGRPRYLGLILTAVLLVILALVAAWSTFFLALDDDPAATDATEFASAPLDGVVPDVEDEMAADQQDPADFVVDGAAEDGIAALPSDEIDPAAADLAEVAAPSAQELATPAPETGLTGDTTTIARNDTSAPQDEIFLAAIDDPPQAPDPSALGTPEVLADGLPAPALPPPPFGTVYQFDADGNIVPTPEGIATPEGVLLVAGKPALVPTSRPAAVVAAAAAARATLATPEAGTEGNAAPETGAGNPSTLPLDSLGEAANAPVFADPALKDFRPVARPSSLQVPSQSGAVEDPTLAPEAGSRFASLRPQPRPAAIMALAAPPASDPTTETTQTASLVTDGQVLAADRSPLAVAISRKPATRPADLSRSVEAAVAEANQEPAAEAASASTAATAEAAQEADEEPEHTGAMPSLPTSASVAKQATVKDAVNLSKLTLIGIYGTSTSRYALVRQPNGRLVKVSVGDRLDGGKVAAISTSDLTYQKGGRSVTLEMPRT